MNRLARLYWMATISYGNKSAQNNNTYPKNTMFIFCDQSKAF